jgi:hypothetical protein
MYVCSWMWMWKGMAPSKAPPNIPKTGLVYHALTAEKGGAEGSPSPLIAPRGPGIGFSTEISKAYVLCRTDQPHSDRQTDRQTGYGFSLDRTGRGYPPATKQLARRGLAVWARTQWQGSGSVGAR